MAHGGAWTGAGRLVYTPRALPLVPVQPGAVAPAFQPTDPQAAARGIWADWTRGMAGSTAAFRRSDLALFGDFTWGARDVFAVIRRVIATLERGSDAFRELAVTWHDAQRERGAAIGTLARQWSTLAQLVAFIGRAIPRRGSPAPSIGPTPRMVASKLDGAAVSAIVACAIEEGRHDDAVIVALACSRTPEKIATLTVGDLRGIGGRELAPMRVAIDRVCARRHGNAHAFPGQRIGRAMTPRGIRMRIERNGTTAAALRRLGRGEG